MYISHKYKFVFLRTPKTASSSLSDFFVKNIDDPNAIYTPVDDTRNPGKNLPRDIFTKYDKFSWAHLQLQDVVDYGLLDKGELKNYKKIAVIRNPVDRQLSLYYHFKNKNELGCKRHEPASLLEYRSVTQNGHFQEVNGAKKQADFLKYDNKIIGTYILYENLQEFLKQFMNDIGLIIKYPLPNHKSHARPKVDDFKFELEDVKKIKEYFKEDFELYEKLKK